MTNNKNHTDHNTLFYPPGGLLIWIVIYLELLTFGIALIVLAYQGSQNRELFHTDSGHLNKTIAAINTILLLTAGYFAAKAVLLFKAEKWEASSKQMLWAIIPGAGFLLLKCMEYYEKLKAGLDMETDTFFMFYWLLTGFHWIHVLVGVVILLVLRRNISRKKGTVPVDDVEAGVAFWHLCDIIWLLLFPLLYLLF